MPRPLLRQLIVVTVALAIGAFAFILVRSLWYAPQSSSETSTGNDLLGVDELPGGKPARLRIPKIAVDAVVVPVGLTSEGAMAVPGNYTDVGWYRYGAVPGEQGGAVIDGHVDNGLALPGVFKRLGDLAPGDRILVRMESGEERVFTVLGVERYDYRAVPMHRLLTSEDDRYLHLITCTGRWVSDEKTYNERLVVSARRVVE